MISRHSLLICLCLTLGSVQGWAQTTTSNLIGTLTDQSGAVVPNVQVQLTDQATGAERQVPSSGDGLFRFTNVAPASYALTVKASGFKVYNVRDIKVGSSETRDLGRVALEVGSQSQQVD